MSSHKDDESISGILNTAPVVAQSYGRWLGVIVLLFALSRHHRRHPFFLGALLTVITAFGAKLSGLY